MSFGLVLLLALASVGLTNLVVHGRILEVPRAWIRNRSSSLGYLVGCYQCSGFWCGLFVGLIGGNSWAEVMLWAFASSFLASFSSLLSDWLIAQSEIKI